LSEIQGIEPGPQSTDDVLGGSFTGQRLLGEGEFPGELDCFNWVAHFFPWFWSAFYGVWWPYLVLAAGYLIGPGLRLALPGVFTPWVNYLYLRAGWAVVICGFTLWFGVNANRLAWRAAERRGAGVLTRTVDGLGYGQRAFAVIGVTLLIVGWGVAIAIALRTPQTMLGLRVSANAILAANLISIGTAVYLSTAAHGRTWRILALRQG